jgi:hypothetical protein
MSPEQFQELLEARPFTPLRVHLSSGQTHDIIDADTAHVGREVVVVGIYDSGSRFPRWRLLPLFHINSVAPLTPAQLS